MPIYFNSSPVNFPFQFDSIGNNWDQEPTLRPDGFPLYHYLQTQEGCGILTIDGRDYTIEENQGVLLAPGVSHALSFRIREMDHFICYVQWFYEPLFFHAIRLLPSAVF